MPAVLCSLLHPQRYLETNLAVTECSCLCATECKGMQLSSCQLNRLTCYFCAHRQKTKSLWKQIFGLKTIIHNIIIICITLSFLWKGSAMDIALMLSDICFLAPSFFQNATHNAPWKTVSFMVRGQFCFDLTICWQVFFRHVLWAQADPSLSTPCFSFPTYKDYHHPFKFILGISSKSIPNP